MKKKPIIFSLSVASLLASATVVPAATITMTGPDAGTPWNVQNVANWHTTGNTMDGMQVTVTFAGSSPVTSTGTWSDNSGASGDGWSLTMPTTNIYGFSGYTDNTWYADAWWIFENTGTSAITSLVIDGYLGDTVFDIHPDIDLPNSTLGSLEGRSVVANSLVSPDLSVFAEYSNIVSVNGNPAVGDLYQTVTFDFSQQGGTFSSGMFFKFALDTDNVNAPVPEPATILLFGIGAAGVAAFRRRRELNTNA